MLKEYQRLRLFKNGVVPRCIRPARAQTQIPFNHSFIHGVVKRKFGHRRLKKAKQCRISSFIIIITNFLDDKIIN